MIDHARTTGVGRYVTPEAVTYGVKKSMPNKDLQAQRIAAEAAHQPRPAPGVIDTRYRLQPTDLAPGITVAVVRTVSAQGIEQSVPLLHFAGMQKPLLLDVANRDAMTRLTGSPLAMEWIGSAVALRVVTAEGRQQIRLAAPDAPTDFASSPRPAMLPALPLHRARMALYFLLALAAALGAVYLIERLPGTPGG